MTAEEVFGDLLSEYGEAIGWEMLPFSDRYFLSELKVKLGADNPLFHKPVWAVAYNRLNGDALYLFSGFSQKGDLYRSYHLRKEEVLPEYREFIGLASVKEYIEEQLSKSMPL